MDVDVRRLGETIVDHVRQVFQIDAPGSDDDESVAESCDMGMDVLNCPPAVWALT